mmetsp:Transcript_18677/g.55357  ORF Transcript_18677/g.55357 Transcript_18677/m.55357 type:complete len:304 (-) Transcript_18677:98-1009(-)
MVVSGKRWATVVALKDPNCIFPHALSLKRFHNLADASIKVVHHRRVEVTVVVPVRCRCVLNKAELVEIRLRNLEWRVHNMRVVVKEERRLWIVGLDCLKDSCHKFVFLVELLRPGGVAWVAPRLVASVRAIVIRKAAPILAKPRMRSVPQVDKTAAAHFIPVVVGMAEVVKRSHVTPSEWSVVGRSHPSIPFPGLVSSVACALHHCGHPRHVPRDATETRDGVGWVPHSRPEILRVDMGRQPSRLQCRPRGRAELVRIRPIKLNARLDKPVHYRRLHLVEALGAVPSCVGPPEIIRKVHHNVW